MTIKTTDMETVYDLGQKMIEQIQKGEFKTIYDSFSRQVQKKLPLVMSSVLTKHLVEYQNLEEVSQDHVILTPLPEMSDSFR